MKQSMVVTNLRMPRSDYLQVKAMAGELGMSVNEYIHTLVTSSATKRSMAKDNQPTRTEKRHVFFDAMLAISKMKNTGKKYELSEDDKIIYDS
ncbi:MAG: hypothetical protein AAB492_03960 [Patescibacteria group bacterium]